MPAQEITAIAREVLYPEPCWYGQYDVDGTVKALGWFGVHHCVWCAVAVEAK